MNNLAMHAVVVIAIARFDVSRIKGLRSTKGRAEIKRGLIETLESRLRVAFIIILILSQIHAHALLSSSLCCHADERG